MPSDDNPKDVFKFWQSMFIDQVKSGGKEFTEKMLFEKGVALGRTYIARDMDTWEVALTNMIKGMGGVLKIYGEGTNFHSIVTYPFNMCVIGGPKAEKDYNIEGERISKVDLFQSCLCNPYLRGFLAAFG
ncbi:MAG TPA: hypothetical protein VKK79_26180, partial [Candidatus Lokiarchaeia archaeon]|nr:hypothetical protein [Candidatus Lokiarchaeia archaeon]